MKNYLNEGYINVATPEQACLNDSEYTRQAFDFCLKYGVDVWIKRIDIRPDSDFYPAFFGNPFRGHYHFIITRNGKRMSGYFTASHFVELPSCYDLLACLEKNDVGTMGDFVQDFGYTIIDKESFDRAQHTWKRCKKEFEGLIRLFGTYQENAELWNELIEIV